MNECYSVDDKFIINGKTIRKSVRPIFNRGEYSNFRVRLENYRDGAFTTPHIYAYMLTNQNYLAMRKPQFYEFKG